MSARTRALGSGPADRLFVIWPSLAAGELLKLALDRLFDTPRRVRVALDQRLGHLLGLLEADVRR